MIPQKLAHMVVSVVVLVWLLPVAWMLWGAFTPTSSIVSGAADGITWTFSNFAHAIDGPLFGQAAISSVVVSLATTLIAVPAAMLSAYGILRWRRQDSWFLLSSLIATRILPPASVLIALIALFQAIGILGTWTSLILVNLALNLGLLTMLAFAYLSRCDRAMDEWYRVQGATPFRAFIGGVLPKVLRPIALLATVSFLLSWNEFLFASALTAGGHAQTLPVVLSGFITGQDVKWGPMFAACALALLPALATTWILERALVTGYTAGVGARAGSE